MGVVPKLSLRRFLYFPTNFPKSKFHMFFNSHYHKSKNKQFYRIISNIPMILYIYFKLFHLIPKDFISDNQTNTFQVYFECLKSIMSPFPNFLQNPFLFHSLFLISPCIFYFYRLQLRKINHCSKMSTTKKLESIFLDFKFIHAVS